MKFYNMLLSILLFITCLLWFDIIFVDDESDFQNIYTLKQAMVLIFQNENDQESSSVTNSSIDKIENVNKSMTSNIPKIRIIYGVLLTFFVYIYPFLFVFCYSLGWFLFFYKKKYLSPKWWISQIVIYAFLFIFIIIFLARFISEFD